MAGGEKERTSGRWWEYYFVRYFVGTVIGAGAVIFLIQSSSPLRTLGIPPLKELKEVGPLDWTVIAAAGLAYCYVASAPMLTFHAVRAQLDLRNMKARGSFWSVTVLAVAVASGIAVYFLCYSLWSQAFWGLVFFCAVVGLQIALIGAAHTNRFAKIHEFYQCLTATRASDKPSVSQYVESYRHLREHGNAFAIILLEIGLAMILVSVPTPQWFVVLLVLWCLPASYCWLIATVLEARLLGNGRKNRERSN